MADDTSGQAPDLQSILATLANFAPPPQQSLSATPSTNDNQWPEAATQHAQRKPEDPRLRPQGRSTASPKPSIDPASITTWQDGLRCVTKIAAQNASFATIIKKVSL